MYTVQCALYMYTHTCIDVNIHVATHFIVAASQTWTLGRLLPVMVGDVIPEDDKNWEHQLTTIETANYMLAPEIHLDEVAYLGVILAEHHKTFVELSPDASIIPKMHYLLHVPRLMLK